MCMGLKSCEMCGSEFAPKSVRGRFCSDKCSRRNTRLNNSRRCSVDGCGSPHMARGLCKPHYRERLGRHENPRVVVCVVCGKTVSRLSNRVHLPTCSYVCRRDLTFGVSEALPEDHAARWFGLSSDVDYLECAECERLVCYKSQGHVRKYCSERCKELRHENQRPRLPRFIDASCADCGSRFLMDRMAFHSVHGERHYCSVRCSARAGKDRRRARKRNAYVADVNRMDVFESDGWRCHLCGKRIRRDMVVPHPLAATVDHVIPLAAGGTHEPSNCRAAHYLCNSTKGDRFAVGGEQMLLMAV